MTPDLQRDLDRFFLARRKCFYRKLNASVRRVEQARDAAKAADHSEQAVPLLIQRGYTSGGLSPRDRMHHAR